MIDLSGTNSYQYDVLGELTNKVVSWVNGPTMALSYGYDAFGSLTNLGSSSANGVTNACQYALQSRLTNVLANGSVAAGNGFGPVAVMALTPWGICNRQPMATGLRTCASTMP